MKLGPEGSLLDDTSNNRTRRKAVVARMDGARVLCSAVDSLAAKERTALRQDFSASLSLQLF